MRLHCHVSVQVVQCTISLLAAVPTTLVHALDFFIAPSGTLVLLRARNRHERVYGRERVAALEKTRQSSLNRCAHSRGRVKRVYLREGDEGCGARPWQAERRQRLQVSDRIA